MKTLPPIGSRVRYESELCGTTRTCTGMVLKHYKKHLYPEDWDWDSDDLPPIIGIAPHSEWHVTVQVDEIPKWWPYKGTDLFAPCVKELTPLKSGRKE